MYPGEPNRDPYQQNPYGGNPYGNNPYGNDPYANDPHGGAPYNGYRPAPYPNGPRSYTIPPRGAPGPVRGRQPRVQILPRFFLILLVLTLAVALVYFIQKGGGTGRGIAVAQKHSIGSQFEGQGVIVRDETLTAADSITSIDFVAEEGSLVYAKSVLCNVYSAGYNQAEINRLETYRDQIRQYHRDQVKNHSSGDEHLIALEDTINSLSAEVRTLVQGQGTGSLTNVERQLKEALQARQTYLRQKYPDDQELATLYKDENQQLRKIESWTTPYAAQSESLVSFYTDGYETTVNAGTFDSITPAQVHAVLAGQQLETDIVTRGRQPIFRTVAPNVWYILLLSTNREWNPTEGQVYKVQLVGFDNFLVDATVQSFTRVSGELLVRLAVRSDVRPVLNIRTCRMAVGEFVDGLSVPINAVFEGEGGVMGVAVSDVSGDIFVPVTVISNDGKNLFIRPVYPGSLLDGQKVITF